MTAAPTDLLQKVGVPGSATTLSAPGYTAGDASITVGSTGAMPTDTGFTFAIDRVEVVNNVSVRVPDSYCEFVGTVSNGTSITNVALAYGNAQNYAADANTRVYIPVSSTRENRIVTWGLAHADQDGTLKAGSVDSAAVLGSNVVETAKIKDVNVTTSKMKPNYRQIRGDSGATRQTVTGATTAVVTGQTVSYTSGSTTELLDIWGRVLAQASAVGGRLGIYVNGTLVSRASYLDNTGTLYDQHVHTLYEIAASTTVTIDLRWQNRSGTTTLVNATTDSVGGDSANLELIAFGR